jgi:uncharacterized protein involved in tolerance to divalent cations
MTAEANRIKMELTTSDEKVLKLVEYVNNNQPTPYDYPVPDITVLPVSGGNEKYLEFIKESTEKSKKVELTEEETNIHAGEQDY